MDFVKEFKVTKEENSMVKLEGEIPFAELESERAKAIKALGKNIKIDGFREGHVPENLLVEKIGEMAILSEMAERALARTYPIALAEHNIDAIGHPQIQITKIAPDNPLGFTATVAVVPEITLPDYKKLATEANKDKATTDVTDEDLEKQIKDILRQKVAYERMQELAAKQAEAAEETKESTDDKADDAEPETHTHADGTVHEGPAHDEAPDVKAVTDEEIPELTDEIVQTLGQPGQFETVDDFKAKLKEHIGIEKEREVTAAHRAKVTDSIIEATEMDLPAVLVDGELHQMWAQMNEDIARANMKMEEYLQHIKKTEEELREEWKPAAEKRAKLQLILNEIAKAEDVKPDEAQLEDQVKQLLEQYKDADEARVRVYVASVMTNEAVMKMLENQT